MPLLGLKIARLQKLLVNKHLDGLVIGNFGHQIAISQFRSIAMKAGTAAPRVKALSDALAKVAATDDYKAWLKDQYADEKSFIGADGAVAFMNRELGTMRKYAPKK